MLFSVKNVGQIAEAKVKFGDLTVLVGAQGSGKSIFLQLFKLCKDQEYIKNTMADFGQDWNQNDNADLVSVYMGSGTKQLWRSDSNVRITPPDAKFSARMQSGGKRAAAESVYYIPAQRALTMPYGRPEPFRAYDSGTPFAVKNFSEHLRLYIDKNAKNREKLFPLSGKLKQPVKDALNEAIFHDASVSQISTAGQKELRLRIRGGEEDSPGISYMAWSAGQREFFPLLLGCYELLPGGKSTKDERFDCVVIEEPEMGLHPKAIFAVMTLTADLLSRGYKVILSTHSPSVLDIVWAVKTIKAQKKLSTPEKTALLQKLFFLRQQSSGGTYDMLVSLLEKSFSTYYFYYDNAENAFVKTKDISILDPGDDDEKISGWGGLSGFSGHAADVVADAVERSENAGK